MAGTVTPTVGNGRREIKTVSWAWISDGAGAANGVDTIALSGEILRVVTNPGSPAPTDNYDIVILDADGADVLGGLGANRDTATTEEFVPVLETVVGSNSYASRVVISSLLTLQVTNAGNAKQGTVTLYYR